ncbi:glycerate kinase [Arthrobacter sp. NPDC057259]|uniref:glycerate kinase n=1 Tax=Arthrobacter sp. NPDC057259 TaxID=3346073 RepID=UPI00363209B0
MRILIAPDKFKGSLTAGQAAAAMAEGVLRVFPNAAISELPLADGGEGTLEAAYSAGYEEKVALVSGPTGESVAARWALRSDAVGTVSAVIETAEASGLRYVRKSPHSALRAHSFGCGQLIHAALDAGASEIIVGLGGSAMTDGGLGAMMALGLRALDTDGNDVTLGGEALGAVAAVDASKVDPRLSRVRLRLAVDVRNPLHGPNGAAHIFGPQKGADRAAVELLDAGLRQWAAALTEAGGGSTDVPGAGAAGGFPAPFLAFTNATLESGYELVAAMTGLNTRLPGTDLVITGEGSLDLQSLEGKAPIALAQAAAECGIPVAVVAGRISVTTGQLAHHGVTMSAQLLDLASDTHGKPDPADAMANANWYLEVATQRLLTKLDASGLWPLPQRGREGLPAGR